MIHNYTRSLHSNIVFTAAAWQRSFFIDLSQLDDFNVSVIITWLLQQHESNCCGFLWGTARNVKVMTHAGSAHMTHDDHNHDEPEQ